ncbi:bifunctional diaminohydroxyphosphoribosylaminopyrimidine deaminase/5-amino-6-(5-phosphoribosylamino)uracil reductase RibD [uncultured Anaerococcus sp.]|uniref:bifunctional diaminohydroxyphosphoribosylaminopyrimidine deaminase/5-amino-6-(5-phosphoribosylamino)uracil reductase RibD n=1 Tax=uncultured Anaerococcus sp. TaxID=293428 RepID=UPI0025E4015A|nr:bifunctional diaminohydroxyphosphoribosylaminopyrimidine deaminase/5-amino-6-(5-phosphoribosylamino)uracil reductase RibD [uncultured Anaerococcus sp.]
MNYEKLMRGCFTLAKKGAGRVQTNPLVGAILFKEGKIIGEGYHKAFGMDHAEIDCFKNAKESPEGATMVVNLEPCSHYGKNPPCVDEIIRQGVKRVVISNLDTNPKVDSLKKMEEAGIEIISGVLKEEGRILNEKFFFNMKYHRPLVSLKYAMSLDGKIATKDHDSKWISGKESRNFVHKLRNDYDAILVGKNTLIKDRARLNCRLDGGVDPVRVIVSDNLDFDKDLEIFKLDSSKDTIIATSSVEDIEINAKILRLRKKDGGVDLEDLLGKLYQMDIGSLLVEGGSMINTSFLEEDLVDKIYEFIAPIVVGGKDSRSAFMGEGVSEIKDAKKFKIKDFKNFGEDIMLEVNNVYRNIN